MPVEHRDPAYMIAQGYLQKMEDFEYQGRTVYASRLGYRITEHFVHDNFGKVFDLSMTKNNSDQDLVFTLAGTNLVFDVFDDGCDYVEFFGVGISHLLGHGSSAGF